jgi:hypothetical protein
MKTLRTKRGSLNFTGTMLLLLLRHHTEDTALSFLCKHDILLTVTSTGEQIPIWLLQYSLTYTNQAAL